MAWQTTCYSNHVSPHLLVALAVGGDWQAAGLHSSLCGVRAAQRRRSARRLRQLPRVGAAAAHRGPGDGAHDPLRLSRPPVFPRLPQQVSNIGGLWRGGGGRGLAHKGFVGGRAKNREILDSHI